MLGIARRVAVVAAGIGAAGTIAFAGQAAAATPHQEASAGGATPAASWHYIDSYFWGSTCNDIGTRGMDNGDWSAYECRNGGTWSDYDLYVLY